MLRAAVWCAGVSVRVQRSGGGALTTDWWLWVNCHVGLHAFKQQREARSQVTEPEPERKWKCWLHAVFLQVCICELQMYIVQAQRCVTVFHYRDLRMFYCDDTCLRIRKLLRKSGSEGCWEQIAHHSCLQTDKTFKNQRQMNIIENLVVTDFADK